MAEGRHSGTWRGSSAVPADSGVQRAARLGDRALFSRHGILGTLCLRTLCLRTLCLRTLCLGALCLGALCLSTSCVTVLDGNDTAAPALDPTALDTQTSPPPATAPLALPAAEVTIDEIEGLDPTEATLWQEAIEVALFECRPTQPGLVHLAILRRGGDTVIEVVGPTALEAATLECVLSSLSMLEAETIDVVPVLLVPPADSTPQATPSDLPPVMSSQITVSW